MIQQKYFQDDDADFIPQTSPPQSDEEITQTMFNCNDTKKTVTNKINQAKTNNYANSKLPKNFIKNRKNLVSLIQNHFAEIKDEYLKLLQKKFSHKNIYAEIEFREYYLNQIKRNIKNYLVIKHIEKSKINISIPDSKEPVFMFCPDQNMMISYDGNNLSKKIYKKREYIPDIATPIFHQNFIYLLDGSTFQQQRNIFLPAKFPIKINLQNGESQILENGRFQRIKCAVVKHNNYIYTLGGFVTDKKLKTATCERYNLDSNKWQNISNLSQPYICSSACVFNNTIYIFSRQRIQKLQMDLKMQWTIVPKPYGFIFHSFSYVHQISKDQIILMGGCHQNKRLEEIQIFNVQKQYFEKLQPILPCGITNQRISKCIIHKNKILSLSPIYGQVYPQMGIKKGMVQVIITGSIYNYLKTILINQVK